MSAVLIIALLWIAFAATHMGLASVRMRPKLVARLGERPYQALYSLVALAIFVPLVWYYTGHKHFGAFLWTVPKNTVTLWATYIGNGVAFVLLTASFVQPSPATVGGPPGSARGVLLITRHPLFMAIALWGLLHLVFNASASDLAFFGGAVLFSLAGAWHQDQRKLATGPPEFREFHASTPFLPFTGPRTLEGLRGLPPVAVIVGVGLTILLRYFHSTLFGP
jgi:uncharacterized membrane protein